MTNEVKSSRTFLLFVLCWIGALISCRIHQLSAESSGCFATSDCHASYLVAKFLGLALHEWAILYFAMNGLMVFGFCARVGPKATILAHGIRIASRFGLVVACSSLLAQLFVWGRMCPHCVLLDAVLFVFACFGWSFKQSEVQQGEAIRLVATSVLAVVSLGFLVGSSNGWSSDSGSKILAIVNREAITERDLRREIGVTVQPFEEMKYAAESHWLEERIDHLVLLHAAKQKGMSYDQYVFNQIGDPPSKEDAKWQHSRDQLIKRLKEGIQIERFLKKPPQVVVELDLRNAILLGDPKAPVKLVVVSDFECAFCKLMESSIRQFCHNHPKDVLVAFWPFPLKGHRNAKEAAMAAYCADAQHKYSALHELLYKEISLNKDSIRSAVKRAGLDMSQFDKDMQSPETAKRVDEAVTAAEAAGIDSIPTIFMNGKLVGGTLGLDDLELLFRQAIANGTPNDQN